MNAHSDHRFSEVTSGSRFILRVSMVALPVGVIPRRSVDVSSQQKCLLQTWTRGLKSEAFSSDTGVMAAILVNRRFKVQMQQPDGK